MTKHQMTPRQVAAFAEYARDEMEGYAPANDNRTAMMTARRRRDMMEWAQSRMNDAGFRPFAVQAMFEAQQR